MKRSSTAVVVADAGPLIALAGIDRLALLQRVFSRVLIPGTVKAELRLGESSPGSSRLSAAVKAGWLCVETVAGVPPAILAAVDPGEAEAIVPAQNRSLPLLIDDAIGRKVAVSKGVHVFGTGAVLLRAKELRFLVTVKDPLDAMDNFGYRISQDIRAQILRLAGE